MSYVASLSLYIIRCELSDFADFLQALFFDDFNFATINSNEFFGCKLREGTDGIASGHVREVGKVFARKVDTQGRTIFFDAIALFQEKKRFGQAAADMLLCQVDGTCIGHAKVVRQLLDEEHG